MVILCQILALLAYLVPCLTEINANEVPRWFSDTGLPKFVLPPQIIKFLAQSGQIWHKSGRFWPKVGFSWPFGGMAHQKTMQTKVFSFFMRRIGSSGQDLARLGKFQGFLNLSLRASAAQLGLDIVDQMWKQFGWDCGSLLCIDHVDGEK